MRRALVLLLVSIFLAGGIDAAKRKKKAKRAKAAKKTEQVPLKESRDEESVQAPEKITPKKTDEASKLAGSDDLSPVQNLGNEMDAYRAIQKRPEVTVQDLADLLLMYRGEYGKIKTQSKRLERARELDLVQKHRGEEKLDRGTLAYAIMRTYHPEQGWLFWITGWERYALRDVQEAGIMPGKATEGQTLSGEQLLGTITAAEEYVTGKNNWGK